MKTITSRLAPSAGTLLLTLSAFCQAPPPLPPPDPFLDGYGFQATNASSFFGVPPLAATNLVIVPEWDGNAVLFDSTNTTPVYLKYCVTTNDRTNICFSTGALELIFICCYASADTNQNGSGPGTEADLLAAGDTASGLWRVFVGPAGTNIVFGGTSNSVSTVFVSAPISWPSNSIHLLGINYTETNSTIYLDGALVGTGNPVSIVPATNTWTNGFATGSDLAGYSQCQGILCRLALYDSNFSSEFDGGFFTNRWPYYSNLYASWLGGGSGADFAPGSLLPVGGSSDCTNGTNVYMTNMSYAYMSNLGNTFTFTIEGGSNGGYYDVFSATNLAWPLSNATWNFLGSATNCGVYAITNLSNTLSFFVLGTPELASDGSGLTVAYERLVRAPTIIVQSQSQAVDDGSNLTFTVTLFGTQAMGYQWTFDGTNIAGATGSSYTITNAQEGNAGSYSVIVTNFYGSVTSTDAVLSITPALYVAIADGDTNAAYSYDGINWSLSPKGMPSLADWYVLAYGNGTFVAISDGETNAAYSTDGINWTASPGGMPSPADWQGVAYGNGTFAAVAYGYNTAAYSTNGINWTATTIPGSYSWDSVVYGNGTFVAISYGDYNAAYSTNGITWTASPSELPFASDWQYLAYGNGTFVAIDGDTNLAYSTDGSNWTAGTMPFGDLTSPVYGNGEFLGISDVASDAVYSTNGINWTATGVSPSWIYWFNAVYGKGKFVALTIDYDAAYSTDGINWTTTAMPSTSGSWFSLVSSTNESGPPFILTQSTSQTILESASATFSVTAMGQGPLNYQWQFDGTNITGATNSSLTFTNAQSTNQGTYQAIISSPFGSITNSAETLTVILPPVIVSTSPAAPVTNWITAASFSLSVTATAEDESGFPLSFQWQFDGTNIPGATRTDYTVLNTAGVEGEYTVQVTNAAGSTSIFWDLLLELPGMVEAWGDDSHGECDRPATLTTVSAIAAGEFHSVAVTDSGTVTQWGEYSDGTSFYTVGSPPALTNAVAVAASRGHDIALKADGTVTNWGLTNDIANSVPMNLSNITAVAAGWYHNLALSNGTVIAWGANSNGQTNVPSDLTNAIAIAAGEFFSLALRSNGTVEAWGDNTYGQTNVPAGLTNVVAITAGGQHCLALNSNGTVVAWGNNDFNQTNVPTGMSNVMAIAAGDAHSLALINDGTFAAWGNNSNGQATLPSGLTNLDFKLIAAGGSHSMVAIYSPLVQYPVDVSKDLLLIYNTNSLDSSNVCQYYLTHRPMVSSAIVLGIGVTTNEVILPADFTNYIQAGVQNWLSNNPTKRPSYVVLFQDIPQEVDAFTNSEASEDYGASPSVQYQLHYWTAPGWFPFVTAINMNGAIGTNFDTSDGTNDCIAYIDKLISFGSNYSPGKLFISASGGCNSTNCYNNTNWYLEFAENPPSDIYVFTHDDYSLIFNGSTTAAYGVTNVDPTASIIGSSSETNAYGAVIWTAEATNVAGYFTGGWDGGMGSGTSDMISFAVDGQVIFSGNSGWYVMETLDSFSGQRVTGQSSYLTWFSSNAFGGTNYSNTPVGAMTSVEEPGIGYGYINEYYGGWAAEKSFAISVWAAQASLYFQAVGDPFVRK